MTRPHETHADPFEELAAATEAVTVARRALTAATDRLRAAVANYAAVRGDAVVPGGWATSSPVWPKGLGTNSQTATRTNESIESQMLALIRGENGRDVTFRTIENKLGAKADTIRGTASRLVANSSSGVVRVRPGVVAYRPAAPKAPAQLGAPASRGGRPPSTSTSQIDAVLDRVLQPGAWMKTAQIVDAVRAELGSNADKRVVADRLYKRSRGDAPTLLTRGEYADRAYSQPPSINAGVKPV
jgi:predicted NBD/HSP70 family sugar kinase